MSKQLLHMQKLAGLITESEYNKLVTENSLKEKIKELVHSSLGEAKKKKDEPEDVAPQEDTPAEDTLEPTDMGMDMPTSDTSVDTGIDIDPKVKNIQDLLQKAYANAKALGDEKLMTQIGNTITMVVRNQVLGGQVAESSLEEIQLDPINQKLKDKYIDDYLSLAYGLYDYDGVALEDEIEAHAKKYGYEDTLRTIDNLDTVQATRQHKYDRNTDPLKTKSPGNPIGNLMMRDPKWNVTSKGKMHKLDIDRLKMKIKQNLGLKY